MTTGFKHDLKALCELAHSHGALVYADAVQAIGNIPVDVRDSGVDFLAASTYKWLMGDFGAGFMYARADRLGALGRPVYGYEQLDFEMAKLPYDPQPGASGPMTQLQDAHGHLEIGSEAEIILVAAVDSMQRIAATGVDEISAPPPTAGGLLTRQAATAGVRASAPPSERRGSPALPIPTPRKRLRAKLNQANVRISVYTHWIRVAPSVYNDMGDMEKLNRGARVVSGPQEDRTFRRCSTFVHRVVDRRERCGCGFHTPRIWMPLRLQACRESLLLAIACNIGRRYGTHEIPSLACQCLESHAWGSSAWMRSRRGCR